MKKQKKILAIIGIVCLVLLYLSTLIFAFIDTTTSLIFFKTAIGASIFFPVILYVMSIFYKYGKPNTTEDITCDGDAEDNADTDNTL